MLTSILSLIQAAVVFGTVIMLGCIGEILSEKSGSLNLGVPGIMYIGAIAALVGVFFYEGAAENPSPYLCILIAAGRLFSFLTMTLRVNQNVTGLTLTIFGSGVANFFGGSLNKLAGGVGQISVSATSDAFRTKIPELSDIPIVGPLLFQYGFMVYFAVIAAILLQFFLTKTSAGLNLRAVGESPDAADAAGIHVIRYKYLATCIGAGITGLGGVYYVMDYIKGTWANDGSIEKLGWLAVALVIFTTWKPKNSIWGAYVFGLLYWAYYYIPGLTRSSQEIFKMLPYIVTIIVLIVVSFRNKKENLGPAHLGRSYFREER